MQGIGMALCGTCPAMVWIQLANGYTGSLITIAGGLFGATMFGLAHPILSTLFEKDYQLTMAKRKKTFLLSAPEKWEKLPFDI